MGDGHRARMEKLGRQFDEAMARLIARVERTGAEAGRPRAEGWNVAQIAWHVAKVNEAFAGVLTGRFPGAEPAPPGFAEREWAEVVAAIPQPVAASGPSVPPATVAADEALARLRASADTMRAALKGLTPERAGHVLRSPLTGTISLYQVVEWATAHVIRHNAQAKRVLGR